MDVSTIKDAIQEAVVARGCFIVDITVGKDNVIILTIESESSTVMLEDCEFVSRQFESLFDREKEDYELTVSSAGLDQPFRILKQYVKAVGTSVEVAFKGGRKMVALLTCADEEGIVLKYTSRESVEGSRKKVDVEHEDRFLFTGINYVKPYITFE